MSYHKITEEESLYNNIHTWNIHDIVVGINTEDKKVAVAVEKKLHNISLFIERLLENMKKGGRLFYIGAGTSGRLGIVDASECPPTFGVDENVVIGIIAGGDQAIRKAVEFAEDSNTQGWEDLKKHHINHLDTVIGIAASGNTPYVVHALKNAKEQGILTSCITCNPGSPVSKMCDYPIEIEVGPEFITGSTRMKSGTAQKMVLNIISTTVMIKLGRVEGNKMTHLQLSNHKLWDRGARIIAEKLNISYDDALKLLTTYGSVQDALKNSKI